MKKCPYCGFDNAEQAENCKRCRAGFPTEENKTNNNEPETLTVSKKKKGVSNTNGT